MDTFEILKVAYRGSSPVINDFGTMSKEYSLHKYAVPWIYIVCDYFLYHRVLSHWELLNQLL